MRSRDILQQAAKTSMTQHSIKESNIYANAVTESKNSYTFETNDLKTTSHPRKIYENKDNIDAPKALRHAHQRAG